MTHTIENYKGYEIRTKNDTSSHSSLIYKDGAFVAAVSGDIVKGGMGSIEKAKIKIDNLTK